MLMLTNQKRKEKTTEETKKNERNIHCGKKNTAFSTLKNMRHLIAKFHLQFLNLLTQLHLLFLKNIGDGDSLMWEQKMLTSFIMFLFLTLVITVFS